VGNSANIYLVMGAILSFLASLAHIGIIFGGPKWYRFFGAGEKFAKASEQGKAFPGVITFCIALLLAGWGLSALSAAGAVPRLPFLKAALSAITAIYLLRGIGGFGVLFVRSSYSPRFIILSSAICAVFGFVHLAGLIQVWEAL
jgi:hypothetical protein